MAENTLKRGQVLQANAYNAFLPFTPTLEIANLSLSLNLLTIRSIYMIQQFFSIH